MRSERDSKSVSIAPKSIRTNYLYNLIYEVFALLTPLITTPYVSRILGADGVGAYSFTHSIVQYFILLGNLGVATYGQMEISAARNDPEKLSKVFYELWIFRMLMTVISIVAYGIFSYFSRDYRVERFISGIYLFATMFDIAWLFRGIEDFSKIVFRNLVVKFSIIILVFLLVKTPKDVNLYIFLNSFSVFLGNVTFLYPARKILKPIRPGSLNIWRHFRSCLIFFVPTVATSVYTVLDKTMLGYLTPGVRQNGYYEQAHKIEQILIVVLTSLNMIMRSRMAYLYKTNQMEEMKRKMDRSLSFILMISIPMCLGLITVAPTFIPLFLGNGFTESITLLQIFALLLIIISLSNCLNTHFLGPSGRQGKNNYVLIGGAVLNFVLNYISIPRYGAIGASVASVVAEMFILIGYLYLCNDFIKWTKLISLGWKYAIAALTMFLAILSVNHAIQCGAIVRLALDCIIGAVVYFAVLFVMKDSMLVFALKNLTNRVAAIKGNG